MQKFLTFVFAFLIWGILSIINAYSEDGILKKHKTPAQEQPATTTQTTDAKDAKANNVRPNDATNGNMSALSIYDSCKQYFEHQFNTRELIGRKSTCTGYFFGVGSTLILMQSRFTKTGMCLPSNISTEDIIRTFLEWGKQNKNELHKVIATEGVIQSLKQRYPCSATEGIF